MTLPFRALLLATALTAGYGCSLNGQGELPGANDVGPASGVGNPDDEVSFGGPGTSSGGGPVMGAAGAQNSSGGIAGSDSDAGRNGDGGAESANHGGKDAGHSENGGEDAGRSEIGAQDDGGKTGTPSCDSGPCDAGAP